MHATARSSDTFVPLQNAKQTWAEQQATRKQSSCEATICTWLETSGGPVNVNNTRTCEAEQCKNLFVCANQQRR